MKKYTLLLLLGSLLLTGCSIVEEVPVSELEDYEEEEEEVETITDTSSSEGETSEEESSVRLVSKLKKEEYSLFPQYYVEKLNSFSSYKAVTSGSTTSLFNITQDINNTVIKNGDYAYQYNVSEGSMHKSSHEAYYHNNKAAYKDRGDTNYTVSTMTDYLKAYGTYPFADAIEGYAYAGEAITSVTRKKSQDENFVFLLKFDIEKATENVKVQMKKFGDLNEYPTFKNISITITVKDDYTPVKIDLVSKYGAKKGIDVNCDQKYTVTFSNFNEDIEIPGLDNIKGLLD